MIRLARAVFPGHPHHLTQRDTGRQQTFFSDADISAALATSPILLVACSAVDTPARCVGSREIREVSGTVVSETRYGPPNYGEKPGADARVRVARLQLAEPVRMCAESIDGASCRPTDDVTEVQLRNLDGGDIADGRWRGRGRFERAQVDADFLPVTLVIVD